MSIAAPTDRRGVARSRMRAAPGEAERTLWERPASTGAALFAVVALLVFAQLHVPPFRDAPTELITLATLVFLVANLDRALDYLRHGDKALLALVALAPLSALWSVDPDQTLDSARSVLATTAVGLYLALRFDARRQLRLIVAVLTVAALVTVIILVVAPHLAVEADSRGAGWRGAFVTKNVMGRAMSLGAIAAAMLFMISRHPRRWLYLMVAGLCGALAIASWSKFALGMTVLGALVLAAAAAIRSLADRRELAGIVAIALVAGTVGFSVWVALDLDGVLGTLGRDTTLTGRTGLWSDVIDSARQRPIGGYGYGAFWQGWNGPSSAIWIHHPWGPPHAHNGFLDLVLNVGLVGAMLWVTSLVISTRRALLAFRRQPSFDALWPLVLLGFIVAYNLTEVSGPQHHLLWTVYVALSFTLSRTAIVSRASPSAAHRTRRPEDTGRRGRPVPARSWRSDAGP